MAEIKLMNDQLLEERKQVLRYEQLLNDLSVYSGQRVTLSRRLDIALEQKLMAQEQLAKQRKLHQQDLDRKAKELEIVFTQQ